MTQLSGAGRDSRSRAFLFSPASCYPTPAAYVVDDAGTVLHTWSHASDQPSPEDNPPNYLRGWNHVEVDSDGNLFATVPLRSLLKLTAASELEWSCDVSAHHDLAIEDTGTIHVLTEAPRLVRAGGRAYVIQDNRVTTVDPAGTVKTEVSVYDMLRTDPVLRDLVDDEIQRRDHEFQRQVWPSPDSQVPPAVIEETREILRTARYDGEPRRALRRLRDLPGKPCDVMHTNTLELLDAHPQGLWDAGDILLCMRELNLIAAVEPGRRVRWYWGADELSGPHQPSVLPDGRVLVFDNGIRRGSTRLVIVEPGTGDIVWSWSAQPPESFFCPLAGGCERLPNGNLLVTNSTAGAAFELTMDGDVTWRMVLPVDVYGAQRGRVSIYRMSAVAPDTIARLERRGRPSLPTQWTPRPDHAPRTASADGNGGRT